MCLGTTEPVRDKEKKQPIYNVRNKNHSMFSICSLKSPISHFTKSNLKTKTNPALSLSTNFFHPFGVYLVSS